MPPKIKIHNNAKQSIITCWKAARHNDSSLNLIWFTYHWMCATIFMHRRFRDLGICKRRAKKAKYSSYVFRAENAIVAGRN